MADAVGTASTRVRQGFFRPIEIIAGTNDQFTIDDGGGDDVCTITPGVYACIQTLLNEIEYQIDDTTDITVNCYLLDYNDAYGDPTNYINYPIRFTIQASDTFTMTACDTPLAKILGIDLSYSSGGSPKDWSQVLLYHVANYAPGYSWISEFQSTEQGQFYAPQRDDFKGTVAQSGNLAGVSTGATIYHRDLSFVHQPKKSVFASVCDADSFDIESTSEKFFREARTSSPQVATNPATRGFYFFEDVNDGIGAWLDNDMSESGVYADQTNVFCMVSDKGYRQPIATAPTGKQFYGIDVSIHTTDTISTWQEPST